MKIINTVGAQGDVLFRRVDALPPNAGEQKRENRIVVSHSETGHAHAIDDSGVIRYEVGNPMVCYLRIEGPWADVIHHRGHDPHETMRLRGGTRAKPAIYEVKRQREATPEGWTRVKD